MSEQPRGPPRPPGVPVEPAEQRLVAAEVPGDRGQIGDHRVWQLQVEGQHSGDLVGKRGSAGVVEPILHERP